MPSIAKLTLLALAAALALVQGALAADANFGADLANPWSEVHVDNNKQRAWGDDCVVVAGSNLGNNEQLQFNKDNQGVLTFQSCSIVAKWKGEGSPEPLPASELAKWAAWANDGVWKSNNQQWRMAWQNTFGKQPAQSKFNGKWLFCMCNDSSVDRCR